MQDRPLDQKLGRRPLPVRLEQRVQVAQRLQVLAPLPLEQLLRLRQASRRDDDELHEELVLEPPARDRRLDPGRERGPARLGQLVHALAAAVPRHRLTDDEAIALEPPERRVDLAGVQRRQQIAELLLQRLLQLVPVSALATEQREEELSHR